MARIFRTANNGCAHDHIPLRPLSFLSLPPHYPTRAAGTPSIAPPSSLCRTALAPSRLSHHRRIQPFPGRLAPVVTALSLPASPTTAHDRTTPSPTRLRSHLLTTPMIRLYALDPPHLRPDLTPASPDVAHAREAGILWRHGRGSQDPTVAVWSSCRIDLPRLGVIHGSSSPHHHCLFSIPSPTSAAAVELMGDHLVELLASVAEDPDTVTELPHLRRGRALPCRGTAYETLSLQCI